MQKKVTGASGWIAALCAGFATGQDSVSNTGTGLPGDALDVYSAPDQVHAYVVDLVPFTSSWNTPFALGPVVKSGKEDPAFFNNGVSAQSMSATILADQPYASASYAFWSNPGEGINSDPGLNDPPGSINPSGTAHRFALAFAEFGTSYNGVATAVVNVDPSNPLRLFAYRVNTAGNGSAPGHNSAQIGFGAVDAHGNTYFRADDFGVTGPNSVAANNLYRIDALERTAGTLNHITNLGPSDTGDWLLIADPVTHNPPTCIPEDLAGRPVLLGSNFDAEFVCEGVPGKLLKDQLHLGASSDHRGNVAFSLVSSTRSVGGGHGGGGPPASPDFKGSSEGRTRTCAMYGLDDSGSTRALLVWDVSINGKVFSTRRLTLPGNITDNDDGFLFPPAGNSIGGFVHYLSQTAFRGGNGPVAVGRDQVGRTLVATPVVSDAQSGSDNPINAMAVARYHPLDPDSVEWTLAAWNDFPAGNPLNLPPDGKEILDGPGGSVVGQIVGLNNVTCDPDPCGDGFPLGPSLSGPCIDSVGNIWFIAAVELYKDGFSDFDNALIRAVYNPATFSYELEKVLEQGEIFHGANSDTDYMVTFLGIADDNSVSSSTLWSGNILQEAAFGQNAGSLATSDPRTLGGIAVNAFIVYDVDGNGIFDTSVAPDEGYAVVLYIGSPLP